MSDSVETIRPAENLVEAVEPAKAVVRRLSRRLAVVIVLALTCLVYADTTRYQFTYDDRGQILENPALRSWSYAGRCFTQHVWQAQHPEGTGNYYRPLFNLYLLVIYQLFHLNPAGGHVLMVILHMVATLLVYLLARRLLKDEGTALVAALIFGVHAVHIESVAWISGVTEPMLTLFLVGAFLAYLRWRGGPLAKGEHDGEQVTPGPAKWLVLSFGLFTLALLSKETALVMPALIIAYELQFSERGKRLSLAIRRSVPFFALAGAYLVVRLIVLQGMSHASWNLPVSVTLMTLPSVLWFYIRLLLWPVGLSAFYDTPYVTRPDAVFWLMCLGLAAVAGALWVWGRRSKPAAFAAVLMVLPILPVLNLPVFIEKEIAHDRYLYIPSIGFAILLALALRSLRLGKIKIGALPAIQVVATLVVVVGLAALTVRQNVYWTNDLRLFERGVEIAPQNDIALTNYGNELFLRERVDEAIPWFLKVTEENPTYWRANFNLGSCYLLKEDRETAFKYRARAKEMFDLMNDVAARSAFVRMRLGRSSEAETMFQRAMAEHPEIPAYEYGLGIVRRVRGDLPGALAAFKASAAGNPDPLPARTQIAELEDRIGREGAPNGGSAR